MTGASSNGPRASCTRPSCKPRSRRHHHAQRDLQRRRAVDRRGSRACADFLDSKLFVYLFDEIDTHKRTTAERLVADALAHGSAIISFQVVQETLNVLTSKLGASPSDARRVLERVLAPLWRIGPSPQLYERALEVRERYGFSFYDALVVAAAQGAGCVRLLTEGLQHGQRIGDLTVVDPFRVA